MVKVFNSISEWKQFRKSCVFQNKSVGFVATMGNLHEGHGDLIKRSAQENDITVVSIYVNQTQFNNASDFENYPKTFDKDQTLCKQFGADYIFAPSYQEMYPDDFKLKITSDFDYSQILEGQHRPGHFTGVLTVVMKLLMLTKPTHAYFGEKDYQQYRLIADLSQAFFLDTKIIPCKTVRNKDNLALSSRNTRLSEEQLKQAIAFPKALQECKTCDDATTQLESENFKVDYVVDFEKRRYGAAFLGEVRLIDNIELQEV